MVYFCSDFKARTHSTQALKMQPASLFHPSSSPHAESAVASNPSGFCRQELCAQQAPTANTFFALRNMVQPRAFSSCIFCSPGDIGNVWGTFFYLCDSLAEPRNCAKIPTVHRAVPTTSIVPNLGKFVEEIIFSLVFNTQQDMLSHFAH